MAIDATRFSVEPHGEGFAVRDNKQPEGSPFKDGLVYVTPSQKLAEEQRDHLNGVRRPVEEMRAAYLADPETPEEH